MILLFLGCAATVQGDTKDDSRIDFQNYPSIGVDASSSSLQQQQQQHPRQEQERRRQQRNNYGQNNHYEQSNTTTSTSSTRYATLSDIWLCLACALGWTVWWVSNTRQQVDPLVQYDDPVVGMFDKEESRTVMGHVLQISLGEDADGTGIPVYHALVDYVVDHQHNDCAGAGAAGNLDDTFHEPEEPLQVRKCFSTRKLLEEGFANVEVLVLTEDPTMSILFDDYLEEKMARAAQEPPGVMWVAAVHTIAILLIGTSFVGGLHVLRRLQASQQVYGWMTLGIGTILLYPTAIVMYKTVTLCYRWAGPFRPGVIIHGAAGRLDCTQRCGANMNPMDIMLDDPHDSILASHTSTPTTKLISNVRLAHTNTASSTIELSNLKMPPSMETHTGVGGGAATATATTTILPMCEMPKSPLYYPNAGCGFGNFNVHMPAPNQQGGINTLMGDSSVSSMSTGTHSNNSSTRKKQESCAIDSTSSILEKYEQAMEELLAMEELALPKFECN
jgi:hypothetical protein